MNMFLIHAKKSGENWQVIDEAKDEHEAVKRYGEHRFKLGPEWLMCMTDSGKYPTMPLVKVGTNFEPYQV